MGHFNVLNYKCPMHLFFCIRQVNPSKRRISCSVSYSVSGESWDPFSIWVEISHLFEFAAEGDIEEYLLMDQEGGILFLDENFFMIRRMTEMQSGFQARREHIY